MYAVSNYTYLHRFRYSSIILFINSFSVGYFRGCAPSFFPLDEGCRVELESVLVGVGSRRAAPRVELCFCNSNKCNHLDEIEDYKNLFSSFATTTTAIPENSLSLFLFLLVTLNRFLVH